MADGLIVGLLTTHTDLRIAASNYYRIIAFIGPLFAHFGWLFA